MQKLLYRDAAAWLLHLQVQGQLLSGSLQFQIRLGSLRVVCPRTLPSASDYLHMVSRARLAQQKASLNTAHLDVCCFLLVLFLLLLDPGVCYSCLAALFKFISNLGLHIFGWMLACCSFVFELSFN